VTPETAAALEAVALRLQGAGVPFLLGGSALLHALGVDVRVGDLDLVARAEDRAALREAAGAWWRTLTTEPTHLLRSPWKAELEVGGVDVDVLGGLAWTAWEGGPVVAMPFRGEGTWRCGRAEVALAPAAHWLLLYERYRPERAAQLAGVLAPGARAAALAELGLPATRA
jgi:hypothetical protein